MQTTNGSEASLPSIHLPNSPSEQDVSTDTSSEDRASDMEPFRPQSRDREEIDHKLSNYISHLGGVSPYNGNRITSSLHDQKESDYQSKLSEMMLIVDPKTNTSMELVLASIECRYSHTERHF